MGRGHEKTVQFFETRANPYSKHLKKQVTIRLDAETVGYFNALAV